MHPFMLESQRQRLMVSTEHDVANRMVGLRMKKVRSLLLCDQGGNKGDNGSFLVSATPRVEFGGRSLDGWPSVFHRCNL